MSGHYFCCSSISQRGISLCLPQFSSHLGLPRRSIKWSSRGQTHAYSMGARNLKKSLGIGRLAAIEPMIHLGKFDHDLTATSPEIIVSKGNHPKMAELFRVVKYYNLPRIHLYDTVWMRNGNSYGKSPCLGNPAPLWPIVTNSCQLVQDFWTIHSIMSGQFFFTTCDRTLKRW